jgi:hypothetical protein
VEPLGGNINSSGEIHMRNPRKIWVFWQNRDLGETMFVNSRRAMLRFSLAGLATVIMGTFGRNAHPAKIPMAVYKSPSCGCCGNWVEHVRVAGFQVNVTDVDDLGPIKIQFSVPSDLQSCHTALVDGYVIEGHVPASDVARLLAERPVASGLSVPGMPIGSPGMEQQGRRDPYEVVLFGGSSREIYARY